MSLTVETWCDSHGRPTRATVVARPPVTGDDGRCALTSARTITMTDSANDFTVARAKVAAAIDALTDDARSRLAAAVDAVEAN